MSIWLTFYLPPGTRRKLVEVLGEEEADTLMELLLPARWDLIALRNGIPRPTSV